MASWMTNSAFRCITMPFARPRFVARRTPPIGAAVGGQSVPIFREASVYKRRR